MSASISNSNSTRAPLDVIWSRGGGSFQRLLWKEVCEVAGLFGVFALVTLVAAVFARSVWESRKEMFSLPVLVLQLAPTVFSLIVGARAFAREVERGTWELLRSAGASALDVWSSKMLVASISTLGIVALNDVAISGSVGNPISWISPNHVLAMLMALLMLSVTMQCSLWSRNVWRTMLLSAALSLPLAYLLVNLAAMGIATHAIDELSFGAMIASALVFLWTTQVSQIRGQLHDESAIREWRRWWKVFWRMVWKELLTARDFWLAVVAVVTVVDTANMLLIREVTTRDSAFWLLGVTLPLLHSLGCGAIAFSIEREVGTQDWLRRISAPASAVFAAKLLVTQASIVSLTSLLLFATRWIVTPDSGLSAEVCAGLLLPVTLNGLIALGASLLTRRVVPAIFLAFLWIVAIDQLLLTKLHHGGGVLPVLPWWFAVVVLTLATELWLSERWINERGWWQLTWRDQTRKLTQRKWNAAAFEWKSSPALKLFGRLLWRECMEAKGWLWVLPIAFVPSLTFRLADFVIRTESTPDVVLLTTYLLMPACILLTIGLYVLPALLGVLGFDHDQRQGLFRFLADRGGSPTSIWLSKQLVWLPFVVVLVVLAMLAAVLFGDGVPDLQSNWPYYVGVAVFLAFQCFAAGQFLSQLIRSSLISMFLGIVLSLLLVLWSNVVWEVHAPWPYQLGAAAILLFASWMRSRDWLEERWTWCAWLRIVLSVVLPATALVLALEVQGFPVCRTIRAFVIS